MRILISFLTFFLILGSNACKTPANLASVSEMDYESLTLSKKWESPDKFRIPESVCYDPNKELLYVANIDGKPTNLDGEGFISRLSLHGTIVSLEWVSGLNGPKGMAITGNTLFVSDINELVEINLKEASITNRFPAEGSEFLNDVAIDNKGNVYVSDMTKNRIYRLKNGLLELWLDDEKLRGVNGLVIEGDMLLAGANNNIYKIDPKSKEMTEFISNTGPVDGLAIYGNGHYIYSDWQSKTQIVAPGKTPHILLDTAEDYANSADIWYISETNMLYVPTFGANTVAAYQIKR